MDMEIQGMASTNSKETNKTTGNTNNTQNE